MEEPSPEVDEQELQEVAQHLKHLRRDNEQLRTNFDDLKTEYTSLWESYQQVQLKYNKIYDERVNVERHYQQLCTSWRGELEAKQKEFDEAKAQILHPRELELLRLRLIEELELPHKQKAEAFEQEAEQAAAEAQRWKRAAETAEAAAAQTEARCAKRLSTLDSEHVLEVDMLRKQVERLERDLTAMTPGAQQVVNLQTELAKSEALAKQLQGEVTEGRKSVHRAQEEQEKTLVDTQRQIKDAVADRESMSRRLKDLTSKMRSLDEEMLKSTKDNDSLHTQLLALEKERNNLTLQLSDKQKELDVERETNIRKLLAAEQALEDNRQKLADLIAETERDMNTQAGIHAGEVQRMHELSKTQVEAADARTSAANKKAEDAASKSTARIQALDAQVHSERQEHDKQLKHAQKDFAQLREEAGELRATIQQLESTAEMQKHNRHKLATSEASLGETLHETIQQLEKERAQHRRTQSSLVTERDGKEKLNSRVQQAEADAQDAAVTLQRALVTHANQLESLQSNWELERAVLNRKIADVAAQQKHKQSQMVELAQKKLHQYKKQLLHSDKDRQKALLQADEYHEALIKVTQQPLVTRPAEDQQATVSDTGYASQLASLKSRQGNYIDASERTRIAYTP